MASSLRELDAVTHLWLLASFSITTDIWSNYLNQTTPPSPPQHSHTQIHIHTHLMHTITVSLPPSLTHTHKHIYIYMQTEADLPLLPVKRRSSVASTESTALVCPSALWLQVNRDALLPAGRVVLEDMMLPLKTRKHKTMVA